MVYVYNVVLGMSNGISGWICYSIICVITTHPVPRPNAYIYMSPIHVNVHQESILWLAEFIHGVIATVNVDLAKMAMEEGVVLFVPLYFKGM